MFEIITDPAVKKEIDDMFDYGEVVDELNAQVQPPPPPPPHRPAAAFHGTTTTS